MKANYKESKIVKILTINYDLNIALDFFISLSSKDFEQLFKNYLVSIIYEYNRKDTKDIYQEIFFEDKYK